MGQQGALTLDAANLNRQRKTAVDDEDSSSARSGEVFVIIV